MKKVSFFIVLLIVTTLAICFPVSADTVTAIAFDNSGAVAENNLSVNGFGDKDSGYAASVSGGRLFASVSGTDLRKLEWSKGEYGECGQQAVMTGGTKNPWGSGAYLELRVSCEGYENLTFSADIGATNKGPRDFKLQYSIDGHVFTDIAGTEFTVTTNKTMFNAFENVPLPADVNDCDTVFIRIVVNSNILVNGTAGLIGSTGGEVAINNVMLFGDAIIEETTVAPTTTTTTTAPIVTTTVASTTTTAIITASDVTTTASLTTVATTTYTVTTTTVTPIPDDHTDNVDTGEVSLLATMIALLTVSLGIIAVTAKRQRD